MAAGERVAERREGLRTRLREAAEADGFLPFDRFMEIALYDPDVGYYAAASSPFGRGGDFYTAASVSPLFGATLADRIRALRAQAPPDRPFQLVELGPGDGALAADLLASLRDERFGLEYRFVERSDARAAEVESRAREAAPGIPVRRSESIGSEGPFVGALVANEFLDAQPARRLRWSGTEWRELGLRLAGERCVAAEQALGRAVPPPELPRPDEPGTVIEIAPAAEATVREIADHLVAGAAIVIDYGMEESELLRGHPSGTLAAVRGHRVIADPLEAPGETDLSTFVNFTRLRAAARAVGLEEVAFRTQAEALGAWGFEARQAAALGQAKTPADEVRVRLAAKNLLFGFERFRVLELAPPGAARAR
ncbi:MAG TPA: SAM-dependent methyltransferase [Thermoplasmata archaeon]|nr:SAM-dependent methyltransferase [Thermoplasmata archaeon]